MDQSQSVSSLVAKFEELRSKADKVNLDLERTKGALQQLMAQLKSEFEVNSIQEAENLLAELIAEHSKLTKELEDKVAELERRLPQ